MKSNVAIKVYERGKLITQRDGHNVWVDRGRQYLAGMVGYLSATPTPERVERVRYMGLGIGSEQQTRPDLADAPPLSTSYPSGYDPNATNGHAYRKSYSIEPPISTLERPVRITGGSNPYPTAAGTDVWLIDHPALYFTHMSLYELTAHGLVDCGAGELIYSPFTEMPLSEMALMVDEVAVTPHTAYSPVVAYFSFDTILLDASNVIEVIWRARFA